MNGRQIYAFLLFLAALTASVFAQAEQPVVQYCEYDGGTIQLGSVTQTFRFDGKIEMRPTAQPGIFVGEQSLDFNVGRIRVETRIENNRYVVRTTIKNSHSILLQGGRWTNMPPNFKGSVRYTAEFFGTVISKMQIAHPGVSPWDMVWQPDFPRDVQVVQGLTVKCFIGPKPVPSFWDRITN